MCLVLVVLASCDQTGTMGSETIGGTASSEPFDRCPVISFDDSGPRLEATVALEVDTVPAGSNFEGTAVFTNDGAETVDFPHTGTVYAWLYEPGADVIVAVPTLTYAELPGLALAVPAHGEASLPLLGGTTPCGPDAPDVLPAGTYDVRFGLVTHLSEPVAITVTS